MYGYYGLPSEYHDYDIPDKTQPHHPAHKDYKLHHPPPVIAAAIEIISNELNSGNQPT